MEFGYGSACFTKHPFEPMDRADIKFLSYKTFFLLLLASAKRRGHMFSLDANQISFATDFSEVAIGVLPDFVAKTEANLGRPIDHTLVIPALKGTSDRVERALCPVRALKKYLAFTAPWRRHRRLFLPMAKEKEDFTAAAVTAWVKQLIGLVYSECSESQAILYRCVHETRGLATSWAALRGVTMKVILKSAQWKNHTVFTACYLKDFTHIFEDMLILSPIVVAEHVV
jgi:hypothetical protein